MIEPHPLPLSTEGGEGIFIRYVLPYTEYYKADLLAYEKEKEKQKYEYNQVLEKEIDDKFINYNIDISNEILLIIKKIWALQDEILSFINKVLVTT